jgi:hypothetical protein
MSIPSVVPERAGLPCWASADVPKAISRVAQLDASRAHYFLASHTPIRQIRDDRTNWILDEGTLFEHLFHSSHEEVLAVLHGEPGTGKSHLIHWLKLRLDHARETGELEGIVPILIRRRAGSLKDALEQLVEQLPESFAHYLQPVQEALGRISPETARQKLAYELGLELGPRRERDRDRTALPRDLKNLAEVASSQGFRDWLCREGGPIDQNVQRLSESSEVEERENLPCFRGADFLIRDRALKANNIPRLTALIDDLEDEPRLREEAAELFNQALPDALKEMTGLSGNTLRDVFDRIRADLKREDLTLAVFIEDVSVMSALDEDLVNAFEPQARGDLCRTVAVLGMTDAGMKRLQHNQEERITHIVSVGEGLAEVWQQNARAVARFAARYLNALRLPEEEVRQIAVSRRTGGTLTINACTNCPVRERCHAAFGVANVDGQEIGLFPFSPAAPHVLLQHLDEEARGVRRNPRGLLMHVMHPVLEKPDALEHQQFPQVRLPVRLPEPAFWSGFEGEYCGSWSRADKDRLKLLAQGWVETTSAEETASALKPLVEPLGFQPFTREVDAIQPPGSQGSDEGGGGRGPDWPAPPPPRGPAPHPKLGELLQELARWMETGRLQRDTEPRELIRDLLLSSIRWEDQREVPRHVWSEALATKDVVDLVGMRSRLREGRFTIQFERSEETRNLIEALGQFKYLGEKRWNFPYAERHKRTVAQWLRRHRTRILKSIKLEGLDAERPVRLAVQFLTAAALVHQRSRLPSEPDALVAAVLADPPEDPPVSLSEPWQKWTDAVRARHGKVKEFLQNELSVPQGRTGGINFIDPQPVVETAAAFIRDPALETLEDAYFKGIRKSRFKELEGLGKLGRLDMVAHVEREAIASRLHTIRSRLEAAGYTEGPLSDRIQAYCADLVVVLQAQGSAKISLPDPDFDRLRRNRVFQERARGWGRALEDAEQAVRVDEALDVLLYDPAPLLEGDQVMTRAQRYIDALEKLADDELAHIERSGDPDTLTAALLGSLGSIIGEVEPTLVEAR